MKNNMKNFKNVKSINFEVTFDGNGCINFDCSEQLEFLKNVGIVSYKDGSFFQNGRSLNNVQFAKKNYRINPDDGEYEFHYKVSSECLRYMMFNKTMPCQSPTIMNIPHVLYSAISHPDSVLRGYLYTSRNGTTLRKKSPICITDAEEVGFWRRHVATDFHSRSGQKESNEGKGADDAKDNSIYKVENVGIATYLAKGGIDVDSLRFISADPIYDRMAVNADGGPNEVIFLNTLAQNMCNFTPEFKYYYTTNAYTEDEWAERGILLNDESVDMLIKRAFRNILNISVIKRNAYFNVKNLKVTVFCEGEKPETVDVTLDNLDSFYFNCVTSYSEASEEKIIANKKKVEEIKENKKVEKKSKGKKETTTNEN
jgi:hypothetical protein